MLGVTGKAADILNTEEEDRKTANTVFAVVGFVLGNSRFNFRSK